MGRSARLASLGEGIVAAVVGASGGLGGALADALDRDPGVAAVERLARAGPARAGTVALDLEDEASIAAAAATLADRHDALHLVIVATGVLHAGEALQPEKSWRALTSKGMERAFRVNATGPALVAKHFLPLMARERKTVFAALSARVGSIGDNRLGGWHAYRASKAALNMLLRTLSIELARRNPAALCVGLHPGTVDTGLSRPFQRDVPPDRLFAPPDAAERLLGAIDALGPGDSGGVFAWDGSRIEP